MDVRNRLAPATLRRRLIAADLLTITVALGLSFCSQWAVRPDIAAVDQRSQALLAAATLPLWLVSLSFNHLYQARAIERPGEEVKRILHASLLTVGMIVVVAFAVQFTWISRLWVASVLVLVPSLLIVERAVARRIFTRLRRAGVIGRPVLIVGTDADAIGLMHAAQRSPDLGYRIVGFVGSQDIGRRGGARVLGGIDDTVSVLEATGATGVLISLSSVESSVVNKLTRRLTDAGYHVALSSGLRDIDIARFRPQDMGGRTLIYVEPVRRDGWRAVAKRGFDVLVALTALVVTAPITICAALAVKRSSPGPVIFKQERVGRDGRTFHVYKFRTMIADAETRKADVAHLNEADGPMFKIAEDPRITKQGRVLRRLSIDEIPQFINVLRGEMSVVGPRPALASEVEQWSEETHERLRVLPGITGMWQVSGRSNATFDDYKRLDLYYVDNWSLAHDLRIVLRTVSVVLARRGAH